ncbi:hypothetical protein LXL04_015794 [Taraxacum kok-saghyz]
MKSAIHPKPLPRKYHCGRAPDADDAVPTEDLSTTVLIVAVPEPVQEPFLFCTSIPIQIGKTVMVIRKGSGTGFGTAREYNPQLQCRVMNDTFINHLRVQQSPPKCSFIACASSDFIDKAQ